MVLGINTWTSKEIFALISGDNKNEDDEGVEEEYDIPQT